MSVPSGKDKSCWHVFAFLHYCRVIVPDLPAHGARFKETPLTLDNAVSTLHEVIQQEAQGQKVG